MIKKKPYVVNFSTRFDNYLNKLVNQEEERWDKENLEAIEEFNKRVEKKGIFSDGLRSF